MSNLNFTDKFHNWIDKAKKGDKDYMFLTKTSDNLWYLVSNMRAEPIKSLKVAADNGQGLHPIYLYDAGKSEEGEFISTIVIKNDSKMLVASANEINAYGIEGSKPSVKAFFIYIQTDGIHNILFAHEQAKKINVVYDYTIEGGDAIWYCMVDMFSKPKDTAREGMSYEEQ